MSEPEIANEYLETFPSLFVLAQEIELRKMDSDLRTVRFHSKANPGAAILMGFVADELRMNILGLPEAKRREMTEAFENDLNFKDARQKRVTFQHAPDKE